MIFELAEASSPRKPLLVTSHQLVPIQENGMQINGPPMVSLVGAKRHKEENYTSISGATNSVGGLASNFDIGNAAGARNKMGTFQVLGAASTT